MGKLSSRDRVLAHAAGESVNNIESRQFAMLSANASQTILQGPTPIVATNGFVGIPQQCRWSYIGYTQKRLVVDYVQFIQTGAVPVGTQVAELGLATTTDAPDGNPQTFTVVAVTNQLPDLTVGTFPSTVGIPRQNTTAFGYVVSPCTHLWAAMRFNFSTTQPTALGVNRDLSAGAIQRTTSVPPMVVGASYTGLVYAQSITLSAIHPYLRLQVKA